jgi:hypothetical protein
MIYYMSKRETPLLEDDVLCILGLSDEDYYAALREGRLRRSIAIDNDPTGRLAFHNFWDLLEFSLSTQLTTLAVVPDTAASFAAECCDDLAFDEHDLITITGDAKRDYALAQHSWIDDPDAVEWPASLLDWCTRLLLQVGQHIHAVATTRALGASSRHVKGIWDQACAPVLPVAIRHGEAEEPTWKMRQAA